jgi:feruloyl esterase
MRISQNRLQLAGAMFLMAGCIDLAQGKDRGNQEPIRLSRESCTSVQGLAIPAGAIGLPSSRAVVQTAVFVAATESGNANGDFCKVTGIVKPHNAGAPNLEFEVNLPVAWNRRALQMGGGGYDGSLVTGLTQYSNETPGGETPLKQGYVTLGSDGGHKGKPGFDWDR